MRRTPWIGLACLALVACVDKGPGTTQKEIDPSYIENNLLLEVPARMTHRLDADIGGKVVYLGNDLDNPSVAPGGKVRVVHYWKVVEPPGETWRVFAHLVGESKSDWANIDYTDMRQGHGPGKWQAGDIIRDEQEFTVPESWSSRTAAIKVGLFPRGGHTAADRMDIRSGPVDAERRLTVATIEVKQGKGGATPARKPAYAVNKTRGPITIDGVASEDDWKTAKPSPAFLSAEGGPAMDGETRARMVWDDEHLYVFIEARDPDVYSQYTDADDDLWKADVVELFIDADRNRRGYVELQVNPNNAHFDAFFPSTRAAASDKAWSANMRSAVVVHGTPANRADKDQGWDVEIAIPLAAVKGTDQAMSVRLPPQPGDIWRLNVVRIDKPVGSDNIAAASWNAITYRDFHALGRMLEVEFADELGMTPSEKPRAAVPANQAIPVPRPAIAPESVTPVSDQPAGAGAAEPESE